MKTTILSIIVLLSISLVATSSAEVGKNFDTVENPDGTTTWISHNERILDGANWVDYITTETANDITIESAQGSVRLDKINCEFSLYNGGIIGGKTPILVDTIMAQRATFGTENWIEVNQVNNAMCQASVSGNTLSATRSDRCYAIQIHAYQ